MGICFIEKLKGEVNNSNLPIYGQLEQVAELSPAYMRAGKVLVESSGTVKVVAYAVTAGTKYVFSDAGHERYNSSSSWISAAFSTSALANNVNITSIIGLSQYPDGVNNVEYIAPSNGYIFCYIEGNKYCDVRKSI